tara:strand:+ start:182 stop:625 length:444 start_codon:yes stop_codon:yes gene_type:complete
VNILFKINQPILIAFFSIIIFIIIFYLYSQIEKDEEIIKTDYKADIDIINPRFTKEKKDKENVEVVAKKASYLSKNRMFLEGEVNYKSNEFTLKSDMVNFNQLNFDASSKQKTYFKSKKMSIESEGFEVINKGDIISFMGKCLIKIK